MDCRRILIVEDDPMISQHLETIIGNAMESDVVVSASVADAKCALRPRPDFALLDVDVLDGTTYAFASELSGAAIPFAFVSASDRANVPPALRDAPFVAKPYTDDDIVDLLQAASKALPSV